MPIGYGIEDHRSFLIDFSIASLLGLHPQLVKLSRCLEVYNCEASILPHHLIEKLEEDNVINEDANKLFGMGGGRNFSRGGQKV
jgi:hypothetical protein